MRKKQASRKVSSANDLSYQDKQQHLMNKLKIKRALDEWTDKYAISRCDVIIGGSGAMVYLNKLYLSTLSDLDVYLREFDPNVRRTKFIDLLAWKYAWMLERHTVRVDGYRWISLEGFVLITAFSQHIKFKPRRDVYLKEVFKCNTVDVDWLVDQAIEDARIYDSDDENTRHDKVAFIQCAEAIRTKLTSMSSAITS